VVAARDQGQGGEFTKETTHQSGPGACASAFIRGPRAFRSNCGGDQEVVDGVTGSGVPRDMQRQIARFYARLRKRAMATVALCEAMSRCRSGAQMCVCGDKEENRRPVLRRRHFRARIEPGTRRGLSSILKICRTEFRTHNAPNDTKRPTGALTTWTQGFGPGMGTALREPGDRFALGRTDEERAVFDPRQLARRTFGQGQPVVDSVRDGTNHRWRRPICSTPAAIRLRGGTQLRENCWCRRHTSSPDAKSAFRRA